MVSVIAVDSVISADRLCRFRDSRRCREGHSVANTRFGKPYCSIQNDYRQTLIVRAINSNYRYRIVLLEDLVSITETDLWEYQQKISHWRFRFSLEVLLISITAADFRA